MSWNNLEFSYLASCPFCGSIECGLNDTKDFDNGPPYFWASVGCNDCGGNAIGFGNTPQEAYNDAANGWNRRA